MNKVFSLSVATVKKFHYYPQKSKQKGQIAHFVVNVNIFAKYTWFFLEFIV